MSDAMLARLVKFIRQAPQNECRIRQSYDGKKLIVDLQVYCAVLMATGDFDAADLSATVNAVLDKAEQETKP